MRKAAVAVLLLLALSAVAAYGDDEYEKDGYDHDDGKWGYYKDHHHSHDKHPYVKDCPEGEDCHRGHEHMEKHVYHVEVEVPEGHSKVAEGEPNKIPRPTFNPKPQEPMKELKKKVKSWEEPIEDNSEKNERPYKPIEKPQFRPVEQPVIKEHKKKVKSWEEPIEDNTEKHNRRFKKIDLPEFNPKPVEPPGKMKKVVKWDEEPIKDDSHGVKYHFEKDHDWKQYRHEAHDIRHDYEHSKDYSKDYEKDYEKSYEDEEEYAKAKSNSQ